jgi:hypothetical protein
MGILAMTTGEIRCCIERTPKGIGWVTLEWYKLRIRLVVSLVKAPVGQESALWMAGLLEGVGEMTGVLGFSRLC